MASDTRFEALGRGLGKLVADKNTAYGDSDHRAAQMMRSLYPDGVKPKDYANMLRIVRVLDKLCRIATNKDPGGESPWKDIAGYGLLGWSYTARREDEARNIRPRPPCDCGEIGCLHCGPPEL